jgi:hypothetical protein
MIFALILKLLSHIFVSLFYLQIGLTIKIFGLDKALTFGVRSLNNYNISWYLIIILNFNNLAAIYILPVLFDPILGGSIWINLQNGSLSLIFRVVRNKSLVIFKCILYHTDNDYQSQWSRLNRDTI